MLTVQQQTVFPAVTLQLVQNVKMDISQSMEFVKLNAAMELLQVINYVMMEMQIITMAVP